MTNPTPPDFDVVVYSATPSGITAAITAAREGCSVLLVEPTGHVGGLNTSGVNTSEIENMSLLSYGGVMLEVYTRLGRRYGHDFPIFRWESRVLESVFDQMLEEAGVTVKLHSRVQSVDKQAGRIRSICLTDGSEFTGSQFIDASYEGDLMARAGVSYTWGREGREAYDESLAGQHFIDRVDEVAAYGKAPSIDEPIPGRPYDDAGRLRPCFTPLEEIEIGRGDRKVMNYNFRVNVSTADDRVPIDRPAGYDRERFIVLAEYFQARPDTTLRQLLDIYPFPSGRYSRREDGKTDTAPGTKWELNNKQSAVISLGHFGGQFEYPDADYAARDAIVADHRLHNQGLLWFLANDASSPPQVRAEMAQDGLPADEFADNGHWPYQLYVREARRMIGDFVMTQHDVLDNRRKDDVVWVDTHKIDCHHVQRVAISKTHYRNEGRIWKLNNGPFDLPYRLLTPRRSECTNLLVPVAVSCSHVAYCPIRLESIWMGLGQAAGHAAAIAHGTGEPVQSISVSRLQEKLRQTGAPLDAAAKG